MRYDRRMQTLSLNTLADLDEAQHGLAVHCWRCERWHDFDIADFIAKHGNRSILDFKPRCSVRRAHYQAGDAAFFPLALIN